MKHKPAEKGGASCARGSKQLQPVASEPAGLRKWTAVLVAALLLSFLLLSLSSVLQKSPTWDETHYLGAGRYLLETHRWDIPDVLFHPVLWTVWHDLPLLAVPIPKEVWQEQAGVSRGQKIIALRPDDNLLNCCRLSLLPFGLALGLLVFRWSSRLYGTKGGLLSLTLFCFCPNILAHAPLITPDMTLSCFAVLSAYRLWRLAEAPSVRNLLYGGLALGLMLLSKYTAVLLGAIFFLTDVSYRAAAGQMDWRSVRGLWLRLRHWPVLLGIAFLVVWSAYGFRVGQLTLPGGSTIPMPAEPYFRGAIYQYFQSKEAHSFFLMGSYSTTGWVHYFVVVCLIKLPVAILALTSGLVLARRRLGLRLRVVEFYLLAPFILLFLYLSFFNTIQNGFRYLLPAYPLLLVWIGKYGEVPHWNGFGRVAIGVLILWMAGATLWLWPDYLAHFNELAGGPRNGYHWLTDSNLDWGQDLKGLKKFMVQHRIERVQLSYLGTADPAHYGIAYEYLPSANSALQPTPPLPAGQPPARFVALSAYEYQGVDFPNKDAYKYFYQFVPNANIGGSILVYDLQSLIPRAHAPLPARIRSFGRGPVPVDSCP